MLQKINQLIFLPLCIPTIFKKMKLDLDNDFNNKYLDKIEIYILNILLLLLIFFYNENLETLFFISVNLV